MISGEISVINLPGGTRKYILGFFQNNTLRAYLSRGFVTLPSQDYWGTIGVVMYPLKKDDIVKLQYIINSNSGNLSTALLNFGITKL